MEHFRREQTTDTVSTDGLQDIKYGYDVDFEGTGEILQVKAEPQDGARTLKTDDERQISDEVYKTHSVVVCNAAHGRSSGNDRADL